MAHKADTWIAGEWMGKAVEQVAGDADCIGRIGKVVETFFDEVGMLHCRMNTNFWCPASKLRIMDREEVVQICRNDSQIDPAILM